MFLRTVFTETQKRSAGAIRSVRSAAARNFFEEWKTCNDANYLGYPGNSQAKFHQGEKFETSVATDDAQGYDAGNKNLLNKKDNAA